MLPSYQKLFLMRHAMKPKFKIHPVRTLFYERDEKSGYGSNEHIDHPMKMVKKGLGMFKEEFKMWAEEVAEKLRDDPKVYFRHGDYDIVWSFDSQENLDKWVVTSDSDHKQGKSSANLILSKNKKGLFFGDLNKEAPKDGVIKVAGYCNMKCIRAYRSFKRPSSFDWTHFTHLMMRFRGDGRTYLINLATSGYFDITWNDIYNYPLFTRGGPYWQVAKIPFSKFFFSSKGRVQDKQTALCLDRITSMGITCADSANGPFQLEVDYIGVYYDANHTEQFAYELYQVPKHYAGF